MISSALCAPGALTWRYECLPRVTGRLRTTHRPAQMATWQQLEGGCRQALGAPTPVGLGQVLRATEQLTVMGPWHRRNAHGALHPGRLTSPEGSRKDIRARVHVSLGMNEALTLISAVRVQLPVPAAAPGGEGRRETGKQWTPRAAERQH